MKSKNTTQTQQINWQKTWSPLAEAVVGRKHIRNGIPCQDACYSTNDPRPYLIACDGRGSANKSHFGANEAVKSIKRQMTISHPMLHKLLDEPETPENKVLLPILQDEFFRAAAVIQKELAEAHSSSPKDFEFTLILMILGKEKGFYLHIGDGALVIEENGETIVLSQPENGEFANVTNFVQYGKNAKCKAGLIDIKHVTGIAAFSDGTGEKMIQAGTGLPSPGFSQIWKGMRKKEFTKQDLLNFLTQSNWEPKVQDDRCLALLSKIPNGECISDVSKLMNENKNNLNETEIEDKSPVISEYSKDKSACSIDLEKDKQDNINTPQPSNNITYTLRKNNVSIFEIGLLVLILIAQIVIIFKVFSQDKNDNSSKIQKKIIRKKETQNNKPIHNLSNSDTNEKNLIYLKKISEKPAVVNL